MSHDVNERERRREEEKAAERNARYTEEGNLQKTHLMRNGGSRDARAAERPGGWYES
jgi:hypothetical protein